MTAPQMVTFRDQLFTFNRSCNTHRYDPGFDAWTSLKHLHLSSYWKQVAVIRGHIYTVDLEVMESNSTIERFNMGSCSWEKIFTSCEGCRDHSCVVAAGDYMYVLGGEVSLLEEEGEYVAKGERFDTVHNKWEEIADMQQERGYAFGVATQGKIFVAGGKRRRNRQLKSCEV